MLCPISYFQKAYKTILIKRKKAFGGVKRKTTITITTTTQTKINWIEWDTLRSNKRDECLSF